MAVDLSTQTKRGRKYPSFLSGFVAGTPRLKYQDIKMAEPCCVSI